MATSRTLIYDLLDLPPGYLTVTAVRVERWGSRVTVGCLHTVPPLARAFTLVFHDCRGLEWYVQKTEADISPDEPAQLLTHDLGQPNHQRTARLATTLFELIISYRELEILRGW